MAKVLDGIRVLDFGRYIAGPFCAALLADYGAEVIRIDRVGGSEDRYLMPVTQSGEGAYFLQCNRNKRCMTLDIDRPGGREVLHRLLRDTDVVVANMPPRTLANLGLDYVSLSAVKHDIILTASSAFGTHEEVSHRVGFDGVAQAMSGSVQMAGLPDHPTKAMVSMVDFSTALACALGTVLALYERRRSGKGQQVRASLLHSALNLASGPLIEEAVLKLDRKASGNRSPIAGPSDIFRVNDGWIIVVVLGNSLFRRWVKLIGRPELLNDPRFHDDQSRGKHGEALSAYMAEWCALRSRDGALAELEEAKIPAGPVHSLRQALEDETIKSSGAFHWTAYPGSDQPVPIVTSPVGLSRTPPRNPSRSPMLGEHTEEILGEIGYDAAAIAELYRLRVV